jgi:serine/threonine protein kinase
MELLKLGGVSSRASPSVLARQADLVRFMPTRLAECTLPKMVNVDKLRPLGRGASSQVYDYCIAATGRKLALKVPSKERWSPEQLQRCETSQAREPLLSLSLPPHPNVCTVHGVIPVQQEGKVKHALVMDGFEGVQDMLQLVLKSDGAPDPLAPQMLLQIHKVSMILEARREGVEYWYGRLVNAQIAIMDMAHALEHMHRCNIINRDLKLDNFLIVPDPDDPQEKGKRIGKFRVVLIDTGLSRDPDTASGAPRSADHPSVEREKNHKRRMSFCGTAEYLAPEVFANVGEGGSTYDYSSDLWSLGACIYTATTLYTVPGTNTSLNYVHKKGSVPLDQVVKAKSRRPSFPKIYPKALQELVQGLLQPNPEERMTLQQVLRSRFVSASPATLRAWAQIMHEEAQKASYVT